MFVRISKDEAVNLNHVARIAHVSTVPGVATRYTLHSDDGTYLGSFDILESGETNEIIERIHSYDAFIEVSPVEAININYIAKIALIETRTDVERVWRLSTASGRTLGHLLIAAGDTENPALKALTDRGLVLTGEKAQTPAAP